MASTAKKSTKSTTTTKKAAKKPAKKDTQQLRKDVNPAASWPFPVYTKS